MNFTEIADRDREYLRACAAEQQAREADADENRPTFITWREALQRRDDAWMEAYKRAEKAAKERV